MLMRRLLDGERVRPRRAAYTMRDALCEPRPDPGAPADPDRRQRAAEDAARGGRARRRLEHLGAARGRPDALATLQRHCAEIGRDIATIEKTVSFPIILRDDAAAAETRIHELMAAQRRPARGLRRLPGRHAGRRRRRPPPPPGSRLRDRDRPHAGTVRRRDHRPDRRGRGPSRQMKVVLLAGGVGGAKLAEGLAAHLGDRT